MGRRTKNESTSSVQLNRDWLRAAALVVLVIVAYQPALIAGYIWDDVSVVTGNPVVVGPLGLKEVWTTQAADICPLTLTTFWAEHKLWGVHPLLYHLVNILQHAASAVALWFVLRRLRIPGAWLGASLWALHPVEVESVAWITEMKNTQSGLCYLLAIFFFVRGLTDKGIDKWNYLLTLLLAAMAMASKSSTVILPLVLCLCTWWVQRRWDGRKLLLVAPIFLMSLAAGALSVWTQKAKLEDIGDPRIIPGWPERIATAGDAIWFYLGKLIWPHPLVTFYPRWDLDPHAFISYLPSLAVIIVLVIFWANRNSWARPLFFAYAYFLIALLPVLGLIDNTIFSYAPVFDHLQYLASMGPVVLAGATIYRLGDFVTSKQSPLIPALATGLIALLAVTVWFQACVYLTEEKLWKNTLRWYPDSEPARYDLAQVYLSEKRHPEAIALLRSILENSLRPSAVRNSLSRALAESGNVDAAIHELGVAIELNPTSSTLHDNLGTLFLQKGEIDRAIGEFQKALAVNANDVEAHYHLGLSYAKKGAIDNAIAEFRRALELNPLDSMARNNLGVELLSKGEVNAAIDQFREALRVDPHDSNAANNLEHAESIARSSPASK